MNILSVRSYEERTRDHQAPLRAMLELLVHEPSSLEIAEDPRVFGRRCTPAALRQALFGLQRLDGLEVGSILALEPTHLAGVPWALMLEIFGGRGAPGDRGVLAELRQPGRAPAFLGVLLREGQVWALFNGLALWRKLRAV
ncbi:MAG: hypothetical protein U1E65_19905 [Myxococcota bacterium]